MAQTELPCNIRPRGKNISVKVDYKCVTFSGGNFDNLFSGKSFYFLRGRYDLMTPPKAKLALP